MNSQHQGEAAGQPDATPKRIQRKRTRGWRMPASAVYVGRPSKWGNRFGADNSPGSRGAVVRLFRRWVADHPEYAAEVRRELAGRDLACWCPLDGPCHADVLLELANPTADDLAGGQS